MDCLSDDFKVIVFKEILPLLNDPDVPVRSVTIISI